VPKVLITGGTGLVGQTLSIILREKGYEVAWLSRNKNAQSPFEVFSWNISDGSIEDKALDGVDYILHLAGAGIADKKWTAARKKVLENSRIKSTRLLYDKISGSEHKPKAFISASAIGFYGFSTTEHIYTEDDPPADDYLGELCQRWENTVDQFEQLNIRTVKIRIGIVLSKKGGALEKMALPVKFGLGAALGSGRQYFAWIHIRDLAGIFLRAIEDDKLSGPYNAVAPEHVTNDHFNKAIAKVVKRPYWLPKVPGGIFKVLMGEMAGMLLNGSRVSSKKIRDAGFKFEFPELEGALRDLL